MEDSSLEGVDNNESITNDNLQDDSNKKDATIDKTRVKRKKDKKQSFMSSYLKWPLFVLVFAFVLSFAFGVVSEFIMEDTTLIVAIIVIVVFIVIAVLADIVGVAITAVSITPFRSMSAKKIAGAKEAIVLIKNAHKVASIFADVVGDICGVLSGTAGAVVTGFYLVNVVDITSAVLIASLVSAVIAGVTIFGKAVGKRIAIRHCNVIILTFGKIVKVLTFNKMGNKKKK